MHNHFITEAHESVAPHTMSPTDIWELGCDWQDTLNAIENELRSLDDALAVALHKADHAPSDFGAALYDGYAYRLSQDIARLESEADAIWDMLMDLETAYCEALWR